ncbi:MAG: T9SS type A sorting domain-containing protein, partial [Calditrichaceae bacterium]|nr:T9SS type A sorting domain-containing protein [Calditrichaceae bacterium]
VKLEIYNVLGQKVRTLVDAQMQPGRYKATWDGRNDTGAAVTSGVYIYRFVAGDFKSVQKMVLMK